MIPSSFIQDIFKGIDTSSEIYNNKIDSYSSTEIGMGKSITSFTIIARYLMDTWFYMSFVYVYATFNKERKNKLLIKSFFLFCLPVIAVIVFPEVAIRFKLLLKFVFIYLLIDDSFYFDNVYWRNLFIILLVLDPLYDVLRLLTDSFIYGFFHLDNISLIGILNHTYSYKDMLPIK
ncbi:hypothetical protein GCM10027566_06680 [Arachidicoccus ginsenosidivorans]